ncbi:MAG: cell wall-binding repeat-containing protein, partial [Peptostreptococcus porci]|nr:cell wall-binding repeat-containing protein [Peptostreptococcus porci]
MKKKFLSIALSSIFIANLGSTVFASEPVNSSNENVILSSDNSNVETNNSASNTVNSNASNTQSEKITDNSNGNGKVYSFIESNSITERIAGVDRVQTSIAISQFQNDKSEKVILADARNFPDALAASGITNGKYPVLLISGNLQQDIVSEIKRLESSEVIILGGLNSISYDVEQQLAGISTVKKITRLAGEDRYDTCKKIFYF